MSESAAGMSDRAAQAFSRWNRARKARVIAQLIHRKGIRSALIVGCGWWKPDFQIVEGAVAELVPVRFALDASMDNSPGPWNYVRADALALPFPDASFDLVVSNAVIEHVGDEAAQQLFVKEHARVGKTWVITTPNRWFPIESHTHAMFRHWSPAWRGRQDIFTRLLSLGEFRRLLPRGVSLRGTPFSPTFIAASDLI